MTTEPMTSAPVADKGTFSHELAVLQHVYVTLEELEPAARARVIEYVVRRLDTDSLKVQELRKEVEWQKQKMQADIMNKQQAFSGQLRGASVENPTRY